MISLPVAFLPFDPNRDYDDESENDNNDDDDDDDDEMSLSTSDEDATNDGHLHDAVANGDVEHEQKQNRHIGGGVLLVNNSFFCQILKSTIILFIFC